MNTEKALTKLILQHPLDYKWSIQGFGMLRLYLTDNIRLHIWNSQFAVPNVSVIHTHPWDFESKIIVGCITNYRYFRQKDQTKNSKEYKYATIKCGVGGGIIKGELGPKIETAYLLEVEPEVYSEGDTYNQLANEIHKSVPIDGTVTIVIREFKPDTEHALVFWEKGDWVSAEPRVATQEEILAFTQKALSLFN
jgi:hypothetical protein